MLWKFQLSFVWNGIRVIRCFKAIVWNISLPSLGFGLFFHVLPSPPQWLLKQILGFFFLMSSQGFVRISRDYTQENLSKVCSSDHICCSLGILLKTKFLAPYLTEIKTHRNWGQKGSSTFTGLQRVWSSVAPPHVESSQTRDWTVVPALWVDSYRHCTHQRISVLLI